jgi:hypothetical protein
MKNANQVAMTKSLLITLFSFFIYINIAHSQYIIKGKVIDSLTSKPLEYVTVVNINYNKAIYTNERGEFEILVNKASDQIEIRNMGYKTMQLSNLGKDVPFTIRLKEVPIELPELSVNKRKLKKRSIDVGFHNDELYNQNAGPGGYESNIYVVHLKNKNQLQDAFIEKAYFRLGKYIFGRNGVSKARVRIYDINPNDGLPNNDLLRENKIVNINPFSASFSISIEKNSIPFPKEGLFIGLEFFCHTETKPLGKGRYSFNTNCPHIAITKRIDYKEVGEGYHSVYKNGILSWRSLTNGDDSKNFIGLIYKFGAKIAYYD